MIKRHAFTLTETLIMVAVIGIIAVISAISLKNMQPDKDAIMVRKAYTEAAKAVATLINDQELYPYAEVSMLNNDELFQSVIQRSLALVGCPGGLNCPDQSSKLDQDPLLNSTGCYSMPTSSGLSSNMNTMNKKVAVCYMRATIEGSSSTCDEGSTGKGYYCYKDCSYTCEDGYTYNSKTELCDETPKPSSTSSTSSGNSSNNVLPTNTGNDTKAEDISKKTGNSSGSNLKDGSYDDKNYESTKTSNTIALNPHGTVFLNTDVMHGATGYTSANKFAYNFAGVFKTDNRTCTGSVCTFTTPDGMDWTITDGFKAGDVNSYALIKVDINGAGTQPNSATASNPDIFEFKVDPSGTITVNGNDKASQKAIAVLKDRNKR